MSTFYAGGWHPSIEDQARATSLLPMATTPAGLEDDGEPIAPAFSLSGLNRWPFDQGQVGSCAANAAVKVMLLMIAHAIASGRPYLAAALSRWIVRYQSRKLDGSLGSRSDGASIQNSMAAMGPAEVGGVGACREELAPYQADYWYLEARPPEAAFIEANGVRVTSLATSPLGDAWCRSIRKGRPICIGMAWYEGLDDSTHGGLFTQWGRFLGYHALCIPGWMEYQGRRWFQVENSHGEIYKPLAPEIAAQIPGYGTLHADRTTDFWMPEEALANAVNASVVAATASGLPDPFPNLATGLI